MAFALVQYFAINFTFFMCVSWMLPYLKIEYHLTDSRAAAYSMAPLLCGAAPAEVIWRGDFETGTLEQWKGAPKSDGIKIVQEPVREGKYALRIDGSNAARR